MISVADTALNTITNTVVENEPVSRLKPVIICGSCGAQEQVVEENRTECPHCDDYIY